MLTVIGFHSNVLNYLFLIGQTSVPPGVWVVTLMILALPLALTRDAWEPILGSPLISWCGVYAALTVLWFMGSSHSGTATSEIAARLGSILFLSTVVFLFGHARVHRVAQRALLASVIVGVTLNVVDLVRPLTFSPIIGRAAGLYINPNGSAISLTVGMIMSVGIVRPRLRAWYVGAVGLGVLLTFSRGGMAVWLLATALLIGQGVLRWLSLARSLGVAVLLAGGALMLLDKLEPVAESGAAIAADVWSGVRLAPGIEDYSREIRQQGATLAWHLFAERPLVGHGVGATAEWELSESTHNVYLRHLAEHGVVGFAIVPLLVFALLWGSVPGRREHVIRVAVVGLLWGLFSHNLLDERQFLLCAALAAGMSGVSHNREYEDQRAVGVRT